MPPSLLHPKPASEWEFGDLKTLQVDMVPLRIEQFFGCHPEDLPKPQFTHAFLEEILQAGFPPSPKELFHAIFLLSTSLN